MVNYLLLTSYFFCDQRHLLLIFTMPGLVDNVDFLFKKAHIFDNKQIIRLTLDQIR